MVFLASQGNKTIQKPPNIGPIEQFCTILKQQFQASGRSSNLALMDKKYIEEIGLERLNKLFHNLTEWSIGATIKKVWLRFA